MNIAEKTQDNLLESGRFCGVENLLKTNH